MDLTPQQLVQQHVAEIKRLATTEPAPAYVQGALEYTLEAVIKQFPEAKQWLESRIEYSQSQPTPTR